MDPSFLTLLDEPCCPVCVLAHRAQWGWRLGGLGLGRCRGLGLGLGGLGLGGDRGLGLCGLGFCGLGLGGGLVDGLGRLVGLLGMASASNALANSKLWDQCGGLHAIALAAAPPGALLALPLRHVQRPGEQPQVEALAPFRLGPAFFLAVVGGEDVLADAGVRKYRAPGACRTCIVYVSHVLSTYRPCIDLYWLCIGCVS